MPTEHHLFSTPSRTPSYHVSVSQVVLRLDFTYFADTSDCSLSSLPLPLIEALYDTIWWFLVVWYDLVVSLRTIWSPGRCVYNINLRAMHTTILSIRGVQIPIDLVSSATDSIRRHMVLFKPVPIPTSDPKSEFSCQSSLQLRRTYRPPEHLVHLGYLPRLRHHISSILS